jgi:hypothetical protein
VKGLPKLRTERENGIQRTLDRKEEGIAISSTARDATLILTTFYKDLKESEIKENWLYWRKWLLQNWEADNKNLTSHGDAVPFEDAPTHDDSYIGGGVSPDEIPF